MPLVDPILVLADRDGEEAEPTRGTHELLTLARRIGTPVLVSCAFDRAADALIDIARGSQPSAILITGDKTGEAVAAKVAVHLESGIVTDVTDISRDHEKLYAVQESAHGTCRIVSEFRTAGAVITVRPGAVRADPGIEHLRASAHGSADFVCRRPRVLSRVAKCDAGRELVLSEADVVVAGGRGVGSAEGFSLLARLAYALGGCLGGTHTAAELGWAPPHARISLPGEQIRPRLYFAGGVSGSLRHRSAIRGARTVVAIDSDPDAPIFRDADFGIVGDVHRVLPALLDELARRAEASRKQQSVPSAVSAAECKPAEA